MSSNERQHATSQIARCDILSSSSSSPFSAFSSSPSLSSFPFPFPFLLPLYMFLALNVLLAGVYLDLSAQSALLTCVSEEVGHNNLFAFSSRSVA